VEDSANWIIKALKERLGENKFDQAMDRVFGLPEPEPEPEPEEELDALVKGCENFNKFMQEKVYTRR
jgi:hypothetical protein